IEINVTTMQLMGTNGCNSISGGIKTLNETEITFGPLMETRKMCQYMEIPNSFNVNLSKVTSYKREGTSLILKDVNNKALLSFKKID
ncbi:MAG: META domain-containing protein, partial [Flavobacteriaceae bacterium]|nr:META domain-containing protein [Flavobacteriaceae bacterium]